MSITTEHAVWYKKTRILKVVREIAIRRGEDPDLFVVQFKSAMQSQLNISNRLSAILNNTFPPKLEELVAMAGYLNVTLNDLVITSKDNEAES